MRLNFRDNGIGIPAESQENIFGMCYWEDEKREGAGGGLAVVRRPVERMGGAAGIESERAVASTFAVELPAAIER